MKKRRYENLIPKKHFQHDRLLLVLKARVSNNHRLTSQPQVISALTEHIQVYCISQSLLTADAE